MGEAASNSDRSALSQPFVLGSGGTHPNLSAGATSITVISSGATFDGELSSNDDLVVCGTVHGNISVRGSLTVTATGRVYGNIKATTIVFAGYIEGALIAEQALTVMSGAQIIGDIETGNLVVEPGAGFRGKCFMPSKRDPTNLDDVPAT